MIKYKDLNNSIKKQLETICKDNPHNLNAESLYINIVNSKGNIQMLTMIFDIDEKLIIKIKQINEKQSAN